MAPWETPGYSRTACIGDSPQAGTPTLPLAGGDAYATPRRRGRLRYPSQLFEEYTNVIYEVGVPQHEPIRQRVRELY